MNMNRMILKNKKKTYPSGQQAQLLESTNPVLDPSGSNQHGQPLPLPPIVAGLGTYIVAPFPDTFWHKKLAPISRKKYIFGIAADQKQSFATNAMKIHLNLISTCGF